ncbi:MAG: M20/M25/M40 family metallo-hydrolase [Bryobacteraceae bacterium]|nr:M20/M25/M40 family metallo-hydrolase [Bryobacteraceae bacterium]
MKPACIVFAALIFISGACAQDQPELFTVHRIKKEAFENSEVMKLMFQLTDVHGPRLTNSAGYDAAADWVVATAKKWGLANARKESWGPYGKGWAASYFSAHLLEPQYASLIGAPLAWTPGTAGVVTATPVLAPLESDDDLDVRRFLLETYMAERKGKLRDQVILITLPRRVEPQSGVALERYSDQRLAAIGRAPEPLEPLVVDFARPRVPKDPQERRRYNAHAPQWVKDKVAELQREVQFRLNRFLVDEGVKLVIYAASRGDGGTLFPPRPGSHRLDAPAPPPSIALTPEHYNRLARLAENKAPFRIAVEVKAQFRDANVQADNVIAEIPGGARKDELVMIGGHLDDVAYGTGATDNAAGCAVMMEAMRILKTLDLKMDRTVRMALWAGEEQGLLGSKAYVKEHFGDPVTMNLSPAQSKVSAYYNVDNGTGKIRGVYLQGNDMVRPLFSAWLAPFSDYGATTLSIRNTGGTDHLSFDALGIPAFQFIQDPVEYETRTHHSNMDVYDRIQPPDLMQAAAIVSSFVYHTANRKDPLPRKPLPKPWPPEARPKP